MSMESYGGRILTGETEELGERPVSVPLCQTTKPTWTDLSVNLGLRCERLATNRLSHGTVQRLDSLPPLNGKVLLSAFALEIRSKSIKMYLFTRLN
jgi:hypothetical protein